MESLNQNIFTFINSFSTNNSLLDSSMKFIAEAVPYTLILLLVYLWFTNRKNEALYAGYAATFGVIIDQIIGLFYNHNRPFMDNLGHTLLQHKAENSFPSDHTTFTLSIALMLLSFKQTRTVGIIATISALLCGVSRIYCGVHYPFDILGSVIVATIVTITIGLLKSKLGVLNSLIISIWNRIFKREEA